MPEKINLLFDASSIIEGFSSKDLHRSGIYWVAYNLLKQFSSSPAYKITLLSSPYDFFVRKRIVKHFQYSYNYMTFYDYDKCNNNIIIRKNKIRKTKNIIKICYYVLRIIESRAHIILSRGQKGKINNFDIFFSPRDCIPDMIRSIPSIKHFQVLHDCIPSIFKELYPFIDLNHWYVNVVKMLNKETHYFCVSESTKSDFLRIFPEQLDKIKMFVTPNASSMNFSPQYNKEILHRILKKYNALPGVSACYIFSLCTIEPRKNLVFTIKCFIEFLKKYHIDNFYFYLGGGYFPDYIDQFKQVVNDFSEYQNKIIMLGYVDDEDANVLYSNSLFFIFLSQY